ncbi:hypothetical protein C0J52_22202 [Blattella germanica]|nr:hypothetical protein C0J52_22202 [Blattella germanica]
MEGDRLVKKVHHWHPTNARHIGKQKIRWEDDVTNDLICMKVENWPKQVKDRKSWKGIIEKTKAFN